MKNSLLVIAIALFSVGCSKEKSSIDNTPLTGNFWKSNEYENASGIFITEEMHFEDNKKGYIWARTSKDRYKSGESNTKIMYDFTYSKSGNNVTMNIEDGMQVRTGVQNKISLVMETGTIKIYLTKQ